MFCYQCEQAAKGTGCDKVGVCGKQPDVSALQDLLLHGIKGLAQVAQSAQKQGTAMDETGDFLSQALFATLTNVNFDPARFEGLIQETVERRDTLKQQLNGDAGAFGADSPATIEIAKDLNQMVTQGEAFGVLADATINPDVQSLTELLVYGLKGLAAYADHARILGKTDQTIYQFIIEALAASVDPQRSVDQLLGLVLKCGEVNLRAMELLDAGNTGTYGHPVPTVVPLGAKAGKAILVSGHDLKDLEDILKQSADKGIFVYTHGEMLPCHAYPELKKYPHFFGHYGTAWQNQAKEFSQFPGAILMTTNCIQKPKDTYQVNLFTSGRVGWPDVQHISDHDYTPVIEKALALPGFTEDVEGKTVMTGFARNAVMGVADKVIEAVKNKDIRHFFLVGGCDGAKPGRSYYSDFVEQVPSDCIVLTLACGKFRFFDKDLGDIGGIPRLLDVGQCNDAYSAIQIAVALSKAFDCDVNDLPLSMVLSWYEQKAVVILLTLLSLGIKNIRIGPSLPAFISSNVLQVLVDKFNLTPISTPEQDLQAILGE
jgi:hydroxylamine reductase